MGCILHPSDGVRIGIRRRLCPTAPASRILFAMSHSIVMTRPPSRARHIVLACLVLSALALGERPASAQGRDGLLNGTLIGAAAGAGAGIAFTHAVRDSDL